jgi:hypothetical protein
VVHVDRLRKSRKSSGISSESGPNLISWFSSVAGG